MADPTYNVYLSTDKDDPDEGDDGVDFIHFVCKTTSPSLSNSNISCLLYTSPSPRDRTRSRMPSSA